MDAVTPVVDVRAISLVRAGRIVVHDVSLQVARGELVALVGASGSGKTSVLRAIAGLDPLAGGGIRVGDVHLVPGPLPRGSGRRALHRQLGIVFQFHNLFGHLTALENVCLAPVQVFGQDPAAATRQGRTLLDALGVGHRADAHPHALSGGEAQRVAIARALAVEPQVLLMDEPTASLDAGRREDLAAVLRRLVGEGRAVVVASHVEAFVRIAADRRIVLRDGRVAGESGGVS